jgi:hypothetical protein
MAPHESSSSSAKADDAEAGLEKKKEGTRMSTVDMDTAAREGLRRIKTKATHRDDQVSVCTSTERTDSTATERTFSDRSLWQDRPHHHQQHPQQQQHRLVQAKAAIMSAVPSNTTSNDGLGDSFNSSIESFVDDDLPTHVETN